MKSVASHALLPQYMQSVQPSTRHFGTLRKYEDHWIIEAEPQAMEFIRRLFPSTKDDPAGQAVIPITRRSTADMNWLMMRYPLQILSPGEFDKAMSDVREHYIKTLEVNVKNVRELPPLEFKGTLLDFQQQGLAFMRANEKCLLADEMGLGKAQPLDAKILTPNGWKTMREIRVGDYVIGADGKPTQVIGVFPQGRKEIFKVSFSDGSSTECCDEHLWAVNTPLRRWRDRPNQVLELKEIREHLHNAAGNRRHFIPLTSPVQFAPQEPLPINPYLLGLLIGDGGLRHRVRFSTSDAELVEAVRQLLPESVSIHSTCDPYDYAIVGAGTGRENVLLTQLRQTGVHGLLSIDKHIPTTYLRSSVAERIALLQGLMDTDGYVSADNHLDFYTSSIQLAHDMVELVRGLGGTARIRKKKTSCNGKQFDSYRIPIALSDDVIPFRLERKKQRYVCRIKYKPTRAITSVDKVGLKEAQCIKVENEDGLYLTDDYIVTHNTVQALAAIVANNQYPVLIVAPSHLLSQWESEIDKFAGVRVHRISGFKNYTLPEAEVYLIHYLCIDPWKAPLMRLGFDTFVFDEVQEFRHPSTGKYHAMREIIHHTKPKRVYGLSGTPIYNLGYEMFTVMNMIDPGCLGTYQYFLKEYGSPQDSRILANPERLGTVLKEQGLMLRRRKDDVLKELPTKQRAIQKVDIDGALHAKYMSDAIKVAKRIEFEPDKMRGQLLMQAVKSARVAAGVGKAQHVAEFVKILLEGGEPVILFGYHHLVMALWDGYFKEHKPVYVTGEESKEEKAESVRKFMSGETNLIILNVRTTAGLNLQRARCVVFGELDFSPAVHAQAEDRAHRIGQSQSVMVYYMVSPSPSDLEILELLDVKQWQFTGLMLDKEESDKARKEGEVAANNFMWNVIARVRSIDER